MTTQSDTPTATTKRSWIWGHWPALIGVAFAALITFDLVRGVELAPVLAASAVVYLGAAALQRPMAAWPMFFASGQPLRPNLGRSRSGRLPSHLRPSDSRTTTCVWVSAADPRSGRIRERRSDRTSRGAGSRRVPGGRGTPWAYRVGRLSLPRQPCGGQVDGRVLHVLGHRTRRHHRRPDQWSWMNVVEVPSPTSTV